MFSHLLLPSSIFRLRNRTSSIPIRPPFDASVRGWCGAVLLKALYYYYSASAGITVPQLYLPLPIRTSYVQGLITSMPKGQRHPKRLSKRKPYIFHTSAALILLNLFVGFDERLANLASCPFLRSGPPSSSVGTQDVVGRNEGNRKVRTGSKARRGGGQERDRRPAAGPAVPCGDPCRKKPLLGFLPNPRSF